VDSAVADLAEANEHRRSNAAIWVWSRGRGRFSATERDRLTAALAPIATGEGDPATSAQAIAALVALRAGGSVELALAALRDPRREVRHIVAAELGPTGDRRIVDALVGLLDDPDGFVREAATIGLQHQGDPAALEPLRALVDREHEDLVARARAKQTIKALENVAQRRNSTH
jgi:HEAT repeat protein